MSDKTHSSVCGRLHHDGTEAQVGPDRRQSDPLAGGEHRTPWASSAARNRYNLAEENAKRAAAKLNQAGYDTLVAPALPYGVTDFAAGFAGAISIPFDALVDFLEAGVYGYLDNGFDHVCLINHHLEPGQLKALAAVVEREDVTGSARDQPATGDQSALGETARRRVSEWCMSRRGL